MLRVKPRTLPVYLRSKCPTSSPRYPALPFRSAQQVQLFISYSHSNGCFVFSSCLLKSSPVLIPPQEEFRSSTVSSPLTAWFTSEPCAASTRCRRSSGFMCRSSAASSPSELICTTRTRIICEMLTLCMLLNLENHICKDCVVCLCLCNQDGLWSSGLQAAVPADGAEDGGHVRVHPGHPGLHPAGHVRAGQRQLTDNSLDYLQCYEHLKWNGSCAVCFRVSS